MRKKLRNRIIRLSLLVSVFAAQEHGYAQEISLVSNTSRGGGVMSQGVNKAAQLELIDVLRQLEKKYNVRFTFNQRLLEGLKVQLAEKQGEELEKLLQELFKGHGLKYKRYSKPENTYFIYSDKESTNSLHFNLNLFDSTAVALLETRQQNQLTVRGVVTSKEDGATLPGVSVTLKGNPGVGGATDGNGNFTVTVPDGNGTLVFSFIGFATQEVAINNRAQLTVALATNAKALEEVVVVGYGTQKKSDVTGAIVNVSEEEIRSRPVANAIEAMQGKAAGVDITSNERPGEIGQVNIRGVRSLSASNSPLYVVDGIPLMSASGIETLNPLDIESIDVLKDASATAIYGSRGANGVVIVTTKRGKAGKTTLNYSGSTTVENIQDRTRMMDAGEYLTWRRWAYYYSDPARYPRGDQPTQDNDYKIFLGANDPATWSNIMKGWATGSWDGSKVETTDWASMVTQTAVTQIHNLSASGGNEKVRAFGSFGYLDNEGTMKGQYFKRYSSKISVDLTPFDWFEMGASINAAYSIQQYGQSNTGGQVSGPGSIYAAARGNFSYAVPFDEQGNRITFPGGDDAVKTVVDEWLYTDNERKMLRTIGSIYAQLNILPGLRYRVNFGPDFRSYTNGVFVDAMSVNRLGSPNYVSLENQNDFSWTLDNLLFYDKAVGKHTIGATLLQTASRWNQNSSYMRAIGIPLPSQKWNAMNTENIPTLNGWDSDLTERQLMSYMGRLNYGFADKYLLTVSGRWDGASQLAEGHKWSFFPSAALAWRLEQEDWMKGSSLVSQLKMRLGVGTTGNSAIDPYSTQGGIVSLFYPYGSSTQAGYVPSEYLVAGGNLPLANPELGWEKTTQYNLGIDFGVWNNRISGVVDIYTSRTTDLLMQMSIPALTGYTTTFANIGETKNKGIDVTLNTVNVQTGRFSWETSFNAAWQKDEIVSLANGKEDDISNNWFIGQSNGVLYGFASNGLWKEGDEEEMKKFNANGHSFQVGMSRPVDQNNDYRISPNDDRVIIGNTRPRWTTGLTNNFTYRNFDLSIFVFGRLGYTYNTFGEWQGGRYMQRSISYYNENNKDAEYQKPIYNVAGGDPYHGILGYRSGSFLKIRNINLGYTLPKSVTDKLKIDNLKLYVQARNPGMIYSAIDWIDMDTGVSTWNRGYVFGLNVGF